MKLPFNPPVVKHDIEVTPTMFPNSSGEMVPGAIVSISGPPLPGIEIPYNDPNLPNLLQRYSLTELLNQPIKQPEKLWSNYWQTGQLCILAGDMGTGKSTLAIQLAKTIAKNQKVLFIGFELSGADMLIRYGDSEALDNLFYANLNADAFATGRAMLGERLVTALDDMVAETEAQVVIIDQPDRMHLQPAMWNYFMLKLNALKVQQGVSVLITLNNKPRNLSKVPTISSLYKSNLLAPHADSIVAIANHCRAEGKRYIKLLKNTALALGENTLPEVFGIGLQNNQIILQPCGTEREEKVLLPTATERRNMRMIQAEEMRRQGMSFRDIASAMELPERTVRSWVSFIEERDARSEEMEVVKFGGGGLSEKISSDDIDMSDKTVLKFIPPDSPT